MTESSTPGSLQSELSATDDVAPAPPQPILEARDLSLIFPVLKPSERRIGKNPLRLLSRFYTDRAQRETAVLLECLNFSVMRGDRVGVVGANGAGKTTLLRTLCGVYRPSSGKLVTRGHVQGLINIQLGMDPQATGIENIYLRGLQLGMGLSEIRNRLPEIVEFAEIGPAIHDVFGNYSTGMQLRVAIAVSTMMVPDILIMDEWIGAGDQAFQAKLQTRMTDVLERSQALVIASHSDPLLRSICNKGLVMQTGRCVFFGPIDDAMKVYYGERSAESYGQNLR